MDDTDGYADAEKRNNGAENEVVQTLQNKAQSWSKLIAIIGGAIAFHKCAWQMIGWNYNVCPPMMKMRPEHSIKLTDREGNETNTQQFPIDQPNVGLGCRLAPDGANNMKADSANGNDKQFMRNLNQLHSPLMKHTNIYFQE